MAKTRTKEQQREYNREYHKKWYAANKETAVAARIAWKKQNADKVAVYNREYAEKNPRRLREYGLSLAEFRALWASHSGQCGICSIAMVDGGRGADSCSIDHCHTTGKIRGLLCSKCNRGLGSFGDCAEGLLKALAYLARSAG